MDTNANSTTENRDKEVSTMEMLSEKMDKQLFFLKIFAGASSLVLAVILVCALILVPKLLVTLNDIDLMVNSATGTLESANQAIDTANTALDSLTTMSQDVTAVSTDMKNLIADNSATLTSAAKDISEIDFEGLNHAIRDLQDAVGPFAKLMNSFKR